MFERSSFAVGADRMAQHSLARAPLRSESALPTTPYRSPYRKMQPTAFFRSTSSFTGHRLSAGTAAASFAGPAAEAWQLRHGSPARAASATPPRERPPPNGPEEYAEPASSARTAPQPPLLLQRKAELEKMPALKLKATAKRVGVSTVAIGQSPRTKKDTIEAVLAKEGLSDDGGSAVEPSESSDAWDNIDTGTSYASPFRTFAAARSTSPHFGDKIVGGGVGQYTSLSVSSRSYKHSGWGVTQPAVSGSVEALAERQERQAWSTKREEERRKRHVEEQRKRNEELEQTIFGAAHHTNRSATRTTSLRANNAESRGHSAEQQRQPALRWGATRVPASAPSLDERSVSSARQRTMRSVAATAGARSPREAAAAEQQLSLQQRLQLKPTEMTPAGRFTTVRHSLAQPQPQSEPQPEPEPEPDLELVPSNATVGTPPGAPPGHLREPHDDVGTADSSPLRINAFVLVREHSDSSMTPPGPPPPLASAVDLSKVHNNAQVEADELETLERSRKQQRAERRAALGALLAGLE